MQDLLPIQKKTAWNAKVESSRVLTDVPAGAKFTDTNTVTTINGKTGAIAKADIVALGIPAQDTIPANLTLTELVLGNYKLVYNAVYNVFSPMKIARIKDNKMKLVSEVIEGGP